MDWVGIAHIDGASLIYIIGNTDDFEIILNLCRLFLVFFLTAALAGAAAHRDGVGKRTECRRLMGPFLRRAERTTYRLRHDELAGHRWLRVKTASARVCKFSESLALPRNQNSLG
jgi:hypothetical protein